MSTRAGRDAHPERGAARAQDARGTSDVTLAAPVTRWRCTPGPVASRAPATPAAALSGRGVLRSAAPHAGTDREARTRPAHRPHHHPRGRGQGPARLPHAGGADVCGRRIVRASRRARLLRQRHRPARLLGTRPYRGDAPGIDHRGVSRTDAVSCRPRIRHASSGGWRDASRWSPNAGIPPNACATVTMPAPCHCHPPCRATCRRPALRARCASRCARAKRRVTCWART